MRRLLISHELFSQKGPTNILFRVGLTTPRQGSNETPSNQALEEDKFIRIVNSSDIFGMFFYVINVIPQMPLSVIYRTHVSFLWSTRYTQRKKIHVKNLWSSESGYLTPKKDNSIVTSSSLSVTWLAHFACFELVKPCRFEVVVSIGQKKKMKTKNKKRQKGDRQKNFSRTRWLGEE